MIKGVVFGYGNVGRAAVESCLRAVDIQLVGIVSKHCAGQKLGAVEIVSDFESLPAFDVAILTSPSREVPDLAESLLKRGICTVDCYDMHQNIAALRARLDAAAKSSGAAAVTAAGWDPGTDSIFRVVMEAMAPRGITYTDFGPGMSMGHSVAVRAIAGVKDAISMTMPVGAGIHRRMVYVELEQGATLEAVTALIKNDDYFSHDETHVAAVDDLSAMRDAGHGVNLTRNGSSAAANNQRLSFQMQIDNPALTGQVMVSAARAVMRQQPGCYTMIEIAPVDMLPMTREEAVAKFV